MTREEKIAKARELRDQGLSHRQIAERLDVKDPATVWKWLNPERAREKARRDNAKRQEQKNAWQRAADHSSKGRRACSECGGLMGAGSARRDGLMCEECIEWKAVRKAIKVERLWAQGKTFPEICAAMDWSKGTLSVMMDRYREQGYDLPYRYRPRSRKSFKFPEQMAA